MYEASTTPGETLTFPALFGWAAALAKSPRRFLRDMAKKGGYGTPILFLAFWTFASSFISVLVSFVRPSVGGGTMVVRFFGLIASPFLGVLAGFFFAAILFVIWHLMGSREDFQTSFRVWSFISPLWAAGSVLGLIPYLSILVLFAAIYLIIVASEEVHGLPRDRSLIVWGIICGFFLLLGLLGITLMQFAGNLPPNFRMPPPGSMVR